MRLFSFMPLYEFEQVDNVEVKETFYFAIKDCPKTGSLHTDEKGVVWKRILSLPNAQVDTKIDPYNPNDFIEKTGKKKGTFGNLLDASRELSEKRAKDRDGEDPVQKKYFEEYKKSRNGVQHLQERKQKEIKKADYSISYNE